MKTVEKLLEDLTPTKILSHKNDCCSIARSWILSIDAYFGNKYEYPGYLRKLYKWGPTHHPIYWCEVPKRRELDCGTYAALLREIFSSRGLKVLPVQLVQRFPRQVVEGWRKKWASYGASTRWIIDDELVYHEAVGIIVKSFNDNIEIEVWDPVYGNKINLINSAGRIFGIVALKIWCEHGKVEKVYWSGIAIPINTTILTLHLHPLYDERGECMRTINIGGVYHGITLE